jgi:hypothetical protein
MTDIVLAAEGSEPTPENSGRVFCFIHEVAEGFWGGMGTIFGISDIAAFANPELPQTEASAQAREALGAVSDEVRAAAPGVFAKAPERQPA